jgi:PTH2 family peptidyl-tRNA hydrolase
MPIKQVIVIRTRYPDGKGGTFKPRTGKLCAQGAHASMKVFFDRIQEQPKLAGFPEFPDLQVLPTQITILLDQPMSRWVFGTFTKIVVGAPSEAVLVECYEKALAAGLPCAIIEDVGTTEFHGIPTKTAIAIGPDDAEKIDAITGDLPLL